MGVHVLSIVISTLNVFVQKIGVAHFVQKNCFPPVKRWAYVFFLFSVLLCLYGLLGAARNKQIEGETC